MLILLEKDTLYSTFNATNFNELETNISTLSPSMTEYYLSDLASISNNANSIYLSKTNIEKTLCIDSYYSLYIDYNDNIYLEILKDDNEDDLLTGTLW